MKACRGEVVDKVPVWFMRQAGRYQDSYQAIRKKTDFLTLCRTPKLAAQVTLNAVEELGVDAAIIFSDILIPLEAMGAQVRFRDRKSIESSPTGQAGADRGERVGTFGPQILNPPRNAEDIDTFQAVDPTSTMPFLGEAIALTRAGLPKDVPLIGFAGAPLTLAAYLLEGGPSKSYYHLKSLIFNQPTVAHRLLSQLTDMITRHLAYQITSGCQAIQLFDSWAGIWSPSDYSIWGTPYIKQIFSSLAQQFPGKQHPKIFFGVNTATLLDQITTMGADVIGVDWRVNLNKTKNMLAPHTVQGNLDPTCLLMDKARLGERINELINSLDDTKHFIFNLGHGIIPQTKVDHARHAVEVIHKLTSC